MSEIEINNIFDKEKDPMKWIDMMVFRLRMLSELKQDMPVEWARERMKNFIKNLTNNN